MNIEMHPDAAAGQHVHGLPLVKAYCQGRAIGELTGVAPEATLAQWVEALLEAARAHCDSLDGPVIAGTRA